MAICSGDSLLQPVRKQASHGRPDLPEQRQQRRQPGTRDVGSRTTTRRRRVSVLTQLRDENGDRYEQRFVPSVEVKDDVARIWRRRRRRLRRRVRRAAEVIGLLIFTVVVVNAFRNNVSKSSRGASTSTTSTTVRVSPPRADVKMTSCSYADNFASAGLTIVNHTEQDMNYVVYVLFGDGPRLFGYGVATVDHVHPRQKVEEIANALAVQPPKHHFACGVTVVKRFP